MLRKKKEKFEPKPTTQLYYDGHGDGFQLTGYTLEQVESMESKIAELEQDVEYLKERRDYYEDQAIFHVYDPQCE